MRDADQVHEELEDILEDVEFGVEATAGDRGASESSQPSSSGSLPELAVHGDPRPLNRHARALRLSLDLRLRASVDATGWLGDEIEIVCRRARDGTLTPFAVRVGSSALDAGLTGPQGIWARCRRYNAGVRRLRELADRLASLGSGDSIGPSGVAALACAQEEVAEVQALIAWRQATHMPNNVVRFRRLGDEIECLECCDEHLSQVVDGAERAVGHTADPMSATRRLNAPRPTRWLGWLPWRKDGE